MNLDQEMPGFQANGFLCSFFGEVLMKVVVDDLKSKINAQGELRLDPVRTAALIRYLTAVSNAISELPTTPPMNPEKEQKP